MAIFHGLLFFHTVLNLLMSAAYGSGGLLTKRQLILKQKNNDVEIPFQLYVQEINPMTYAMAR